MPENVPSRPSGGGPKIARMRAIHPRWAPWSYLLYAGGFTLLGAAAALLAFFSSPLRARSRYTVLVVRRLRSASRSWLARCSGTAGTRSRPVCSRSSASTCSAPSCSRSGRGSAGSTSAARRSAASASPGCRWCCFTLIAALVARQIFRFPLLMLIVVGLTWFFVTDLISGGGDWTAVVTFVIGLVVPGLGAGGRQRPEPAVRDVAAHRRRSDDRRQPALVPPPRPLRVGADRGREPALRQARRSSSGRAGRSSARSGSWRRPRTSRRRTRTPRSRRRRLERRLARLGPVGRLRDRGRRS